MSASEREVSDWSLAVGTYGPDGWEIQCWLTVGGVYAGIGGPARTIWRQRRCCLDAAQARMWAMSPDDVVKALAVMAGHRTARLR